MDWNCMEGNWKQAKGKVKEQWGKLTDNDLDRIAGKRDQLEGIIQERYGSRKTAFAAMSTIGRPGKAGDRTVIRRHQGRSLRFALC
ncbi:hypothetical protein MPLB_1870054 [Mesorhizobium sp. ORS 3324]|nr:hypothetical protein MPLB_1870054 [Mesorhizobium sp. ORS 3324]